MSDFKTISMLLLAIVMIDAVGDAMRFRHHQIIHHALEVLGIAVWFILMLQCESFEPVYIVMYTLGRIAIFDPLYNFTSGLPLKYIGNSSLYDRFLRKFATWISEPGMLIWVIRALALGWWITWFITNGDR